MSSSSSIAAARRRRAGGPPGPQPPGSTSNRPSQTNLDNTQQAPSSPINPLILLQQHHAKIISMDQMLQDIVKNQDILNNDVISINTKITSPLINGITSPENMLLSTSNSSINVDEISDLVMTRVEGELDLKAFYENDEKLMNEIEGLKTIVQSQQLVINGLSTTLHTILTKLDLIMNSTRETTNAVASKAMMEAEDKAKVEAEEKAKVDDAAKAKVEAEEKAKVDAAAKAKREAEEKAKVEAAAKAKREAEEKAKVEAAAKAKREAEEKAKREAEEKANANIDKPVTTV